ncbi:hypothetical protein DFP72DRAFT_885390 [Ephemerocybe angulata]|uniref:Uncharacterized protein n=1 Tax=Ephemerocybe angulata TaxID=980116 RepID=A0A8H6I602_9AGAR|nr:hypothetical protein DFP72DRAFT_885390 [Tulosesus angulatus]
MMYSTSRRVLSLAASEGLAVALWGPMNPKARLAFIRATNTNSLTRSRPSPLATSTHAADSRRPLQPTHGNSFQVALQVLIREEGPRFSGAPLGVIRRLDN